MEVLSYRYLLMWQRAMDLAIECYELTKRFPRSETYGLVSQLQRAAVSVPSNTAEGRARQHSGEFLQHMSIAYGSLAEVETLTLIAAQLKYISDQQADEVLGKTAEVGRMLNGLRNSIKDMKQAIRA
ncbi:MAG: four helix bundle protein [Sedimentisphaerales bacterium]|nr:four helix bundle protein [Sedimentisphaerales bacterium]